MDTSHIILYQGLTFLAVSTGIMLTLVSIFLIKLLTDLSKLTKNVDETTTIVKAEIKPTLDEFNNALKSINSIAQTADKQVDSLSKLLENIMGVSTVAYTKAKKLSGGLVKGLVQGIVTVMKMFYKK